MSTSIETGMKRVLIIGFSSFLGRKLVDELTNREFNVYILEDNLSKSQFNKEPFKNKGAQFTRDIISADPDCVFVIGKPGYNLNTNFGKMLNAMSGFWFFRKISRQLVQLNKPIHIIYLSSNLMYPPGLSDEDTPLKPDPIYAYYDYVEYYFSHLNHYENIKTTIVRSPWILDYYSWFQEQYIDNIISKRQITKLAADDNQMMFIHSKDLIDGLIRISEKCDLPVVHLFYPGTISYAQFIQIIASKFNVSNIIEYHSGNVIRQIGVDQARIFSSVRLLSKKYNYDFLTPSDLGIDEMIIDRLKV